MHRKPEVDWWDAPVPEIAAEPVTAFVQPGIYADTPTASAILAEVLPEIAMRFPDWDLSDGTRVRQMLEMMALMIEGTLKR